MLKEQEVLNTVISSIDSRGIDETSRFQQWNIEPNKKTNKKKITKNKGRTTALKAETPLGRHLLLHYEKRQ